MSEEGFWIYKNGRRIFIKGRRYISNKNIMNKTKNELYDKRTKQISKDEKPYYENKLTDLKSKKKPLPLYKLIEKADIEKRLKKRLDNLSDERIKIFIKRHKNGK